jgi:hypothetical protein
MIAAAGLRRLRGGPLDAWAEINAEASLVL